MKTFYITYSLGSNLNGKYSKVRAEDYISMRHAVHAAIGTAFAFAYTAADFRGQAENYGLTEVPLQAQVMLDE